MSEQDRLDDKQKLDELYLEEEEELARTLASERYHVPYADLSTTIIDNEALRAVPEEVARKLEVGPYHLSGKTLSLGVISPEKAEIAPLVHEIEERGLKVNIVMVSHKSLARIWDRYKELSFATKVRAGGLDISEDTLGELTGKIHTTDDVVKIITETSADPSVHKISRMLEIILAGAIALDASDVHIEPEEDSVRLRFRLDGFLRDIMRIDYTTHKFLNSRLKLVSGMKLTQTAQAQDGRFSIFMNGIELNVRVSAVPGAYGEGIVMRILNPKSIKSSLETLGIPTDLYAIIEAFIKKPNGLILLTGPTGSGKTTTLYAFLKKIYTPDLKVITIEDPVEYHIAGITQTQVEPEKNYTFLEGLRAALRQDPDIIMVGEIRDAETAQIAVESALTGHLVFSTLHTNTAGGVIPRLIELGVSAKILPSALSLSVAQRLVRILCDNCKTKRAPTDEEAKKITDVLRAAIAEGKSLEKHGVDVNAPVEIYDAVGCDQCNNTGFKGRRGIFEAVVTDETIEKLIPEYPSEREIKKVAEKQGLLDMKEDGIIKVLKGITTLAEVESVVDLLED